MSNIFSNNKADVFLAIDTSNYTSSAALYNITQKKIYQYQKKLEVKEGELGLRQSEAVFSHVKLLPDIINNLTKKYEPKLLAVGVSSKPRDNTDSYMPCFLVGKAIAEAIASTQGINCHFFSHQAGHIISALFSVGNLQIIESDFIGFHISGGTTEMLYITPHKEDIIKIQIIGETLDISAGQVIDRVGGMLRLPFPAGGDVEKLALKSNMDFIKSKQDISTVKGLDCCMSGIESKARQLFRAGMNKNDIAKFCLDSISSTVIKMIENNQENQNLPIVFSGGVMANSIIKNTVMKNFFERDVFFSSPQYATDNAAGIAILASIKEKMLKIK